MTSKEATQQHLYPPYPPDLTPAQSAHLTTQIKDWSIAHGLAVRPATSSSLIAGSRAATGDNDGGDDAAAACAALALATTAPVTLFPSLFPRACYNEAVALQAAFGELYAGIGADEGWLGGVIEG